MSNRAAYKQLLLNPTRFLRRNIVILRKNTIAVAGQREAYFYFDTVQNNGFRRFVISTTYNPPGAYHIPVFDIPTTAQTDVLTPPREMPAAALPTAMTASLPAFAEPAKLLVTAPLDGCSLVYQRTHQGGGPFIAHVKPNKSAGVTGAQLQDWLAWGNGPWFPPTMNRRASIFGRNNYSYNTVQVNAFGIRTRNEWQFYGQYCAGMDRQNFSVTRLKRLR